MARVEITNGARQYLDGLNALDIDQVVSAFAPDAIIRYPGMGTTNPEGFRSYLEQVKSVLAAFHIDDREVFSTENGVAARWTFEATTNNGRTVSCDGIDSWVFDADGRIHCLDVYYDPSPLLEALQP